MAYPNKEIPNSGSLDATGRPMRDEGSRSIWRQGTHQTAGPKSALLPRHQDDINNNNDHLFSVYYAQGAVLSSLAYLIKPCHNPVS